MQYDPFQLQAIQAIESDKSVLVSAPTGAGKTAIAEAAIDRALKAGQRAVYTGPIKALSNQKFRDFSELYPGQVGLLTGDVSLFPDSPLVIMTTEIYRNQLFEDPKRLENTHWVIFDEVHYLDDPERGTVWEEAIMFSPEHMRIVALSATAPNIEELAGWMRSILKHSIEVVIEPHRPVPLHHYFQCQNQIYSDPRDLKREGYLNRDRWPGGWQAAASTRHPQRRGGGRRHFESQLRAKPNRTDELIHRLDSEDKLPCLYFAFGRKRAEELAWENANRFDFLSAEEKEAVRAEYQELCRRFELSHEKIAADMERIVTRGIAFHHAGMLPPLKEVIERLFTSRRIQLIFTTETFALGINMPAKTVVFDELRKFYGTHFGFLRTRDYFQMAGRAGRRGIDEEGIVVSRVNPHLIPHSVLLKVVFGKPEPIESQFNSCYATLINLYDQLGAKLIDVYPRSLHAYQSDKHSQKKATEMIERKLALLKELGLTSAEGVTDKGRFASWMYGYELILAELLQEGALEYVDEAGLAVLLAALTYEPRRNQSEPDLPGDLASIAKRADRAYDHIRRLEAKFKVFPPTRPPAFHLALAVKAWTQGAPFSDMGRFTDIDEGEIIRHLRMVIQLLRQIQHAPLVSDRLRQTATSARKKINRDWVDAEKQLKNM